MTAPATFTFTKLMVADLEAMGAFYMDVFGLSETARFEAEVDGERMREIFLGGADTGALLALVQHPDRPAPAPCETVIGFRATDIDGLFERAERAGATIERAPVASKASRGLKVGILEDPEGNTAEIVERPV